MSYTGFSTDESNYTSFSITKGNAKRPKTVELFTSTPTIPISTPTLDDTYKLEYDSKQKEYLTKLTEVAAIQFSKENSNTYNHSVMKPTLIDARNSDVNSMMIQQNYIYILGSLTLAIVLVGGIVIIKQ